MAKFNPAMGWWRQNEINTKAREMTKICEDHKCPYLKRLTGGTNEYNMLNYCAYLEVSGHSRIKEPENTDPQNCSHWKDENVIIKNPLK